MADTGSGEGPPTPSSGTSEVKRASLDGNEDLTTQLARVRAEKEALEGQYRNLVTKLTTMRQTLGNKMQQDADELDRRAAQIQELSEACGLLRTELEESQGENSQLSSDAQHAQAQLQEALDETEQLRSSSETAELQTSQYRTEAEGARQSVDYLTRELQQAQAKANQAEVEADKQRSAAENLQNVLHEFQTAKDQEITAATDDLREQLQGSLRMLNEYKQRALSAESSLQGASTNSDRNESLEKQVKEKNLLIGKLRHEAVILNEHLTEALRRLKNSSSDNNVDRRLVTNVLISFFNMPRADSKRFEVLQVLASVLQWDDEEKERAGLQRSQGAAGASGMKGHSRNRATSNMSNISTPATAPSTLADQALLSEPETSTNHRRPAGGESMDFAANESFSNLWIEYLLRESGSAAAAAAAAASGSSSSNGANKATSPRPSSAASNSTFGGLSSPPAGLANLSLSPPMRPSVSRQTSPSIVSSAAGSSVGGSNAQEGRRDTPASSVVSDGK